MRRVEVTIDIAALQHNFQEVRRYAPAAKVMAVLKDNAYGHGAITIAKHLPKADGFAVATLSEAIELREAGITQKILLLSGPIVADDLPCIAQHRLDVVIHSPHQLAILAQAQASQPLQVWLKVNTGMHRLGFPVADALAVWAQLKAMPVVSDNVILMTHFACADEVDAGTTMAQFAQLAPLVGQTGLACSAAKSAAIMAWPETHADWVRPGMMLYGISPFRHPFEHDLRPVMGFYGSLMAVQHCQKGDRLGYGGLWGCPETMPVGIVSVGYGDGYFQRAGAACVQVGGALCPVVGLVSMDMMAVDLRAAPCAQPGDRVTLWDATHTLTEVARGIGCSVYELFTRVSARVPRVLSTG